MHERHAISLKRAERILAERVLPASTSTVATLDVGRHDVTDGAGAPGQGEPITAAQAWRAHYRPASVSDSWGPAWGTTWFRMSAEIPEGLRGRHLELRVDLGWQHHSPGFQCEALVRDPQQRIIKALNPLNTWIPVDSTASRCQVMIEAAANPILLEVPPFQPTNLGDKSSSAQAELYTLREAVLVQVHDEVRALAADMDALIGVVRASDETDSVAWQILTALSDAIDLLDLDDVVRSAAPARERLTRLFGRAEDSDRPAHPHRMTAVGHAHIDSAWLWPLRETRRKVTRTLANVCRLLDDGNDMFFALPAAQHVAWLEEDDHELFERVRGHVRGGGIVPVGSMWVEADAVMPGGEAMARQIVEGARYFRDRLGVDCQEIWLPDSFGYSAGLPQIAQLAGIDRFLTQKISWNQADTFPHHTLCWEGLDGTRLFTHFPPADTYNSDASADDLRRAETSFKEKGHASRSLLLYGYGDGGGGPTREMLQRLERFDKLATMPDVSHESPHTFFADAERELPDPPVWVGELYLQLHRGTFTTQRSAKEGNRRSEALLREAELWAATASWITGGPYPTAALRQAWRTMLLCQFHDILPGTCIAWVYRDVRELHDDVRTSSEEIIEQAIRALSQGGAATSVLLNAGAFPVEHHGVTVPALGAVSAVEPPSSAEPKLDGERLQLTNEHLSAVFTDGLLTSLMGTDGREVVPPGTAMGELHLHQDFPNQWDAWDIDRFYRGSRHIVTGGSTESWADETGQHLRRTTCFGNSRAATTWTLAPASPAIEVRIEVDWAEREKLLKFSLPIDVHTDHAAFETQFGHVTRPTHENTSWDAYRFEVPAHRWVRLAEDDWGVAVANESTYGWDVTRHRRDGGGTYSQLRASLLRAPRFPDPDTDQGQHSFAFTIRPASSVPDAIAEGHRLNLPLRTARGRPVEPVVRVDGAVVESVSMLDGDLVVRVYEATGQRSRMLLRCPGARTARGVDLLYRDTDRAVALHDDPDGWGAELRPFQIATVRLSR